MSNYRDKLRKQKQDLLRRHEESVKDKGSNTFGSIIDMSKVPKNVTFWKCSEDRHIIDTILFEVGDSMPKVSGTTSEGRIKKGQYWYVIDLYVHWNVGVLKRPYVCPAHTNGQPCPICEDIQARRDEMTKKEYDDAKAKRRTLYLIWCHDNSAEEAKGIQIFEVAHYFMEYNLKEISERPKGGGTVPFYDPDMGKNIIFTKRGKGAGNVEFIGHRFEDREGPIPDKILDQAFPLDEAVIYPSYNELYAAYYGEEYEPETDSCNTGIKLDEVVENEDRDPEAPFDDGPIEDEGEHIDPDTCPIGGEFGTDCDQLEDCQGCAVWDNCYACYSEIMEQQSGAEPVAEEPEPVVEEPPKPPARRAALRRTTQEETPEPVRKPKPALRRRG